MLGIQTAFGSTLCHQIGFEVGLSSLEGFTSLAGSFARPSEAAFNRVFKVLSRNLRVGETRRYRSFLRDKLRSLKVYSMTLCIESEQSPDAAARSR